MKLLLMFLIAGVLIIGCIDKTVVDTDKENNDSIENLKNEDWYLYVYNGPQDMENSENARMAVIPHLRELGWMGGISVAYKQPNISNDSIGILIPFKLTDESINYINQTLENFSFYPVRLNEVIEVEERPE